MPLHLDGSLLEEDATAFECSTVIAANAAAERLAAAARLPLPRVEGRPTADHGPFYCKRCQLPFDRAEDLQVLVKSALRLQPFIPVVSNGLNCVFFLTRKFRTKSRLPACLPEVFDVQPGSAEACRLLSGAQGGDGCCALRRLEHARRRFQCRTTCSQPAAKRGAAAVALPSTAATAVEGVAGSGGEHGTTAARADIPDSGPGRAASGHLEPGPKPRRREACWEGTISSAVRIDDGGGVLGENRGRCVAGSLARRAVIPAPRV